jgi:hypothetical protein
MICILLTAYLYLLSILVHTNKLMVHSAASCDNSTDVGIKYLTHQSLPIFQVHSHFIVESDSRNY